LFALILGLRLYYIQIIHGQEYVDKADHQYVSPSNNIFDRGNIFFQNKDGISLAAASLLTGYTIAINPQKITDPAKIYEDLSAILPLNVDTFYLKAGQKNSVYQKIADQVPEEIMKKMEALNIPGLQIQKTRWRYYPGDSAAAQTLGFCGL